jgi:hypothetical protein
MIETRSRLNFNHNIDYIILKFHVHRYTPIKPVKFQIGDIVEAHVSIIAIPIRDKKMKTIMILRGLTLLDGTFSQVHFMYFTLPHRLHVDSIKLQFFC